MTNEKMEKAKELEKEILHIKRQLEKIESISGVMKIEISSNNTIFELPKELKKMVLLISKAEYEVQLKQKEEEFKEL